MSDQESSPPQPKQQTENIDSQTQPQKDQTELIKESNNEQQIDITEEQENSSEKDESYLEQLYSLLPEQDEEESKQVAWLPDSQPKTVQQYMDNDVNGTWTFPKRQFRYLDLDPEKIRQLMPQLWEEHHLYEDTRLMKEVIDVEHVPTEQEIIEYTDFTGDNPPGDQSQVLTDEGALITPMADQWYAVEFKGKLQQYARGEGDKIAKDHPIDKKQKDIKEWRRQKGNRIQQSREKLSNKETQSNAHYYDKYIILLIRCRKYGNRKLQVTKEEKINGNRTRVAQFDANGEKILKQIYCDLPGTDEDLEQFRQIVDNFKFPREQTEQIEMIDPDFDEIDAQMDDVYKKVMENDKKGLRTFFTMFYAGHGAMQKNEQFLILNGTEKMVKNKKTGIEEKKWDYFYPIEKRMDEKFKSFENKMFSFVVFDCCRSFHKEKSALTQAEMIEKLQQNEENKSEEVEISVQPRGTGQLSKGINILQICAAQINSTVKDKNAMVAMILSELRRHQANKQVKFPECLLSLPCRFPGCVVQNACLSSAMIPYIDKDFEDIKYDPDDMKAKIPKTDALKLTRPANFDESNLYQLHKKQTEPNGRIYSGYRLNDMKHGFGRDIFQKEYNPNKQYQGLDWEYVFYEGNYKWNEIYGDGLLLLKDDHIIQGEFKTNNFHGEGKVIEIVESQKITSVGEFRHGLKHGKVSVKTQDGQLQIGNYSKDRLIGPCLVHSVNGETYFGLKRNNQNNGLGVKKYNNRREYFGQWEDDQSYGLGQIKFKNREIYKGQFLEGEINGYGEHSFQNEVSNKGFYLNNKLHGLVVTTRKNVKKDIYSIYENGKVIEKKLSEEDVEAINNGTKKVKQMEVFSQPRFRLSEKLDFDFINRQSKEMIIVVDDLVAISKQHKMEEHHYDEGITKEHDDFRSEYDELLQRLKNTIKKVSELDENEGQFKKEETKTNDNKKLVQKEGNDKQAKEAGTMTQEINQKEKNEQSKEVGIMTQGMNQRAQFNPLGQDQDLQNQECSPRCLIQ